MNDIQIGERIKRLRKKRGYTQQELAAKIGVTWEMISRYERGRSSVMQKINELCEALEVSIPTVLGSMEIPENRLSDRKGDFLVESYIPLLSRIPKNMEELQKLLSEEAYGVKVYGVENSNNSNLFALKIADLPKLLVNTSVILPKGIVVCSTGIEELEENMLVLQTRNGVVYLEQYDSKALVIARVLQWVLTF